ncbi:anthocyanin 3'-O-beta-glucosyltransferase-like [Camellia sinensis]|uniref:anthocyanin 3'-O-beta-glucosyltransferase-like n=1 Tax=Camellia sinensis TaxID=4442 RepID=UPI001036B0BF|nr:anthocyanin 3'-O-beta-glucosyltransferase-like [Camellia sinensis]
MDSSNDGKVEMFFLPWIVQRGHMIPAIDTARVFAAHGAKVTIITTPAHAQLFQKSIKRDQSLGHEISFHTFKLPTAEFGLPEGCENLLAGSLGMMEKLCLAIQKLQQPIEQFIREREASLLATAEQNAPEIGGPTIRTVLSHHRRTVTAAVSSTQIKHEQNAFVISASLSALNRISPFESIFTSNHTWVVQPMTRFDSNRSDSSNGGI